MANNTNHHVLNLAAVAMLFLLCGVARANAHAIFVQSECEAETASFMATYMNGTCTTPTVDGGGFFALPQIVQCVTASVDSAWTWTFYPQDSGCTDKYSGQGLLPSPVSFSGVGAQCVAGLSSFIKVDCSRANPNPEHFPVALMHPTGQCPYMPVGVVPNLHCLPVSPAMRSLLPADLHSAVSYRVSCVQPTAASQAVFAFFTDAQCTATAGSYGTVPLSSYMQHAFAHLSMDCAQAVTSYTPALIADCAGPFDHSFDPAPARFTVTLYDDEQCPTKFIGTVANRACVPHMVNNTRRYVQPNCVKPDKQSQYTIGVYSDMKCTHELNSWIQYPHHPDPQCAGDYSPPVFVHCLPEH